MKEKSIHSSEFIKEGHETEEMIHKVPEIGEIFEHNERASVVKQFNVGDKGKSYFYVRKNNIKRGTNINASWGHIGILVLAVQKLSEKQQLKRMNEFGTVVTRPYSITYKRIF